MVTPRENIANRALAVRDAFVGKPARFTVTRGTQRLIYDQLPAFVHNDAGEVVGVKVMVRLFDGLTEIHIDPTRVILNTPTVPRANLTYERGMLDAAGGFVGLGLIVATKTATKGVAYRRIVGAPDPEAALIEAVWDSVDGVPNAPGWRTRGTVTTVYATAPGGNGYVESSNATYATARTGGTMGVFDNHLIGQRLAASVYYCDEACLIFNTSGLPDTDTVSDVVASFDGSLDGSITDLNVIAASDDYNGGAVVTGDWKSGAVLAAKTPYATWNSSGYSAAYNAFTSAGADFNSAINKTGNTAMMLYSDRHRDATVPTENEYVRFTDADAAGTTTDPKLDITHAAGGATFTKSHSTDTILKATTTKAHAVDAILTVPATKTMSIDAVLVIPVTKGHSLDALLVSVVVKVHSLDAILTGPGTVAHSVDTILLATITRVHSIDALVVSQVTKTHQTDSILLLTSTAFHSLDSILLSTDTKVHSIDTILAPTRVHSIDAVLVPAVSTETRTHSVDARLSTVLGRKLRLIPKSYNQLTLHIHNRGGG